MSGKHEPKEIAQEQVQETTPKRRGEGYLLLHDIVYMVAIVTLVFTFVIRMVGVSGPSMTRRCWTATMCWCRATSLTRMLKWAM